MPGVEDEAAKLQQEIESFLRDEGGVDSGDDEADPAPAARGRPGAITPLGVRVDRGAGLLSVNGATATLGEMDSVLSNIRAWKQKHEREMLELRQRAEAAASGAADSPQPSSTAAAADGIAADAPHPQQQQRQQPNQAEGGRRNHQAGNDGSGAANGGYRGEEEPLPYDDEDLRELQAERRERQQRTLTGQLSEDCRQRLRQAGGGGGGGSGNSSSDRSAHGGAAQPPLASVLEAPRPLPGAPRDGADDRLRRSLGPPLGGAPARPGSAARRSAAEAAAQAAVARGQALLAELEAELRTLEGPCSSGNSSSYGGDSIGGARDDAEVAGGPPPAAALPLHGSRDGAGGGGAGGTAATAATAAAAEVLLDWSASLQGVLARMDALQTGYQAAAVRSGAGGAAGGSAVGGSRPGSGGAATSAGAAAGAPPLPRPASARVRLEPLTPPRSGGPGLASGASGGPRLRQLRELQRQGSGNGGGAGGSGSDEGGGAVRLGEERT